jgi:hypothetical protein
VTIKAATRRRMICGQLSTPWAMSGSMRTDRLQINVAVATLIDDHA